MNMHCHFGTSSTRLQANLPGYIIVWFDPKEISKTHYLSNVKNKYTVAFDSSKDYNFLDLLNQDLSW
jgi:hypothetical protein